MTIYLPIRTKPDLASEQWSGGSKVKREPIGPNAEAWLRKHNGPYREARERQERETKHD